MNEWSSSSSFMMMMTMMMLVLWHVYALSILDFLCSRCCVTLLLEMYIVQLGVRTFYKLLAFSPGLLLYRIQFSVLYFYTDDACCNKVINQSINQSKGIFMCAPTPSFLVCSRLTICVHGHAHTA